MGLTVVLSKYLNKFEIFYYYSILIMNNRGV